MNTLQSQQKQNTGKRWLILIALIALAVFMYASIMYKIINFGA